MLDLMMMANTGACPYQTTSLARSMCAGLPCTPITYMLTFVRFLSSAWTCSTKLRTAFMQALWQLEGCNTRGASLERPDSRAGA